MFIRIICSVLKETWRIPAYLLPDIDFDGVMLHNGLSRTRIR